MSAPTKERSDAPVSSEPPLVAHVARRDDRTVALCGAPLMGVFAGFAPDNPCDECDELDEAAPC